MKTKKRSSRMRSLVVSILLLILGAVILWSGLRGLKTREVSLSSDRGGDPFRIFRKSDPVQFCFWEASRFIFSVLSFGGAFFLLKSELMRPDDSTQKDGED